MKLRAEPFGAWVRLDDATLVAVDRTLARSLGAAGGALWDGGDGWDGAAGAEATAPLEAHVAVTSRCPAGCSGCYQSATREGADVARPDLDATLDALAAMGVFTVAFGGGEPMLRDDLGELAGAARARGLVPVVTTSGVGLTPARVESLRGFAQVNVSHDGVGGGYAAVRGFEGAGLADRAIAMLAAAGVAVGVNHVLTRANFAGLADTARHVRALGAREVQLLRYKPAGRAASPDYLARRLARDQVAALGPCLQALAEEHAGVLSFRVDCALVPLLSETLTDAAALARFGVFGCEAGRHLAAVRRDGSLAGCSFVQAGAGAAGESSGRSLATAWRTDPGVDAFRAFVRAPPEPCRSCALRAVCRGGCKVVSAHFGDGAAPDPECPRVLAHRAHQGSPGEAPP